jgi:hypothetical protein
MRLADIMRDIADLIDQKQGQGADLSQNSTQQRMTHAEVDEPELDDEPVMVPALQQKHELLKKVAGVPSAYDDQDTKETGELDRMRKMAGIVVAGDEIDDLN